MGIDFMKIIKDNTERYKKEFKYTEIPLPNCCCNCDNSSTDMGEIFCEFERTKDSLEYGQQSGIKCVCVSVNGYCDNYEKQTKQEAGRE